MIDTGLALEVVEPVWRIKTETASRVRSRIENILSWAIVRELSQGDKMKLDLLKAAAL